MAYHPYQDLPSSAFWSTAVRSGSPTDLVGIYEPKFRFDQASGIATAGSCFAQHISRYFKGAACDVIDVGPSPHWLSRECAHHFIGSPLLSIVREDASPSIRVLMQGERSAIRGMTDGFLFDQVFMPGEELLDDTLTATRSQFVRGGRQESEVYQGVAPTASDDIHMNRDYGKIVLESFVAPIVRRMSAS